MQRRWLVILAAGLIGGCTAGSTTQQMTEDQKQDAILNDPMNYKPAVDLTTSPAVI